MPNPILRRLVGEQRELLTLFSHQMHFCTSCFCLSCLPDVPLRWHNSLTALCCVCKSCAVAWKQDQSMITEMVRMWIQVLFPSSIQKRGTGCHFFPPFCFLFFEKFSSWNQLATTGVLHSNVAKHAWQFSVVKKNEEKKNGSLCASSDDSSVMHAVFCQMCVDLDVWRETDAATGPKCFLAVYSFFSSRFQYLSCKRWKLMSSCQTDCNPYIILITPLGTHH